MLASGSTTMRRVPAVVRPAAICRRPLRRLARRSYQGLMAAAITAAMNSAAANGSTMKASRTSETMVRTSSVQRAACGLRAGFTWSAWSGPPALSFRVVLVMKSCQSLTRLGPNWRDATMRPMVRLTQEPIDVGALTPAHPADGAVCLFLGVVRNENGGRPVKHLEYEAYEDMARPLMEEIEAQARRR